MTETNKIAGKPGLDPTLPDVELIFGDETFHLSYDYNAICQVEKSTGINLLTSIIGEVSASSLRGLLWSALLKDRATITIEEVGKLIRPENIGAIRTAIITAWFGSTPEPDDSGEATAQT